MTRAAIYISNSAIAPLIPGLPDGCRNLADYLEKASHKELLHLDGQIRNYAPEFAGHGKGLCSRGGRHADPGKAFEQAGERLREAKKAPPALPICRLRQLSPAPSSTTAARGYFFR